MKVVLKIFLTCAVFGGLFFAVPTRAADCGGGVPCSCGDTITDDYTMSANLSCSGGDGLYIGAGGTQADPLVINCNGRTIDGNDTVATKGLSTLAGNSYPYVTVQNCTVTDFDYGFWFVGEAGSNADSGWQILNNTLTSNKYGGYFEKLKEATIGTTGSGNTFNSNTEAGLRMEGRFIIQGTSEQYYGRNTITDNTFNNNGHWGLIMNSVSLNTVEDNTITGNGTSDASDCNRATFPTDGCSPGLYVNQAFNNVFDNNTVDNNSGDNLYLDTSIVPTAGSNCVGLILGSVPTFDNIFVNNSFDNSAKGSGVYIDANSCPGSQFVSTMWRNLFGMFYLNSQRTNYNTTPGDTDNIPLFGPRAPWDIGYSTPMPGGNTMSNNAQDGVTVASIYALSLKIYHNDFYQNTITNNGGHGINFFGTAAVPVMRWNDIVDNTITGNGKSGVRLFGTQASRVFGNTISGGTNGIEISNVGGTYYNELGNVSSYGGNSYGNSISSFSQSGIYGFRAGDVVAEKNSISSGGGTTIGMNIVESSGWIVGVDSGSGNTISSITSPGRYLYVGPQTYASSTHPFPTTTGAPDRNIRSHYNHTISTNNTAGGSPIYYYYGADNQTLNGISTKHLQINNSTRFTISNLSLSSADPVEFNFYDGASGTGGTLQNSTLSSCRGPCISLYDANGLSADRFDISNVTISTASEFGVEARYADYVSFDITASGVNTDDDYETGGLYLYHSSNNLVTSSNLTYAGSGLTDQQWEMFIAGYSHDNSIEGTTFNSSGAYEWRPGKIVSTDSEFGDDKFCNALDGDSICDPNCTWVTSNINIFQDADCQSGGVTTCTASGGDCCLDWGDSTDDPDCLDGVDPDATTLTQTIDDGICVFVSGDGICDPNCTRGGDPDCRPTSGGGNGCFPDPDNVCDYDCPAGFDPDCVPADNSWCAGAANNFNSISTPNYYSTDFGNGGGGRPNASLGCSGPAVSFDSVDPVVQGDALGYRDLALGFDADQRGRYKYHFTSYMKFADLIGLPMEAQILTSTDGSSGSFQGTADFVDDPSLVSIDSGPPADPTPAPEIYNDEEYALGSFFPNNPILTSAVGSSYPGNLWTDPSLYTLVTAVWDAFPNINLSSLAGNAGTFYARLQARNNPAPDLYNVVYTGGPESYVGSDITFDYDFEQPSGDLVAGLGFTQASPLHVTWDASAVSETNWSSAGGAHYEVWYGENISEVGLRQELDDPADPTNGPFLWDDIGNSGGLSAFYEFPGGGDYQLGGNGYDSLLSNITTASTTVPTNITVSSIQLCAVDDFGNENCTSYLNEEYVETRYGNIYSGGDVGSTSETFNPKTVGSFIIQAGGQVFPNWQTSFEDGIIENYTDVGFPSSANDYYTNLGILDYLDHSSFSDIVSDLEVRYGTAKVISISNINQVPSVLGGNIYYRNGGLTISSGNTQFDAGSGDQNGSGLIIVNGDLTINKDISYGGSASKLINIPSIAFLVLGDIDINAGADNIVGAYIALGEYGDTTCPAKTSPSGSCGRLSTGADNDQLVVEGLLMARQLFFERTYTSPTEGSELIIYDGRIAANTPLGLEDFLQGLPSWGEGN